MSAAGDGGLLDRFAARLDVSIRHCREADLPLLEWFGAFTQHRQIFREAFDLQRQGNALMLVAVVRDFPVGQAWLDFRPKRGFEAPVVWAVRVLEPLQGAGVGRGLLSALVAIARRRGHDRLQLGVGKENAAARLFYQRLGWRITGELQESFSYTTPEGEAVTHALDDWIMTKDLRLHQEGGSSPTLA
ncbi:GNAT family N-acetyltransferase [Falsiroseomonas sp.]|uniref:GNAT family N-acetyltransferase n=1 Tax=Falsiroseomonas sp. TaxID=2870721 RepID=UPI0035646180